MPTIEKRYFPQCSAMWAAFFQCQNIARHPTWLFRFKYQFMFLLRSNFSIPLESLSLISRECRVCFRSKRKKKPKQQQKLLQLSNFEQQRRKLAIIVSRQNDTAFRKTKTAQQILNPFFSVDEEYNCHFLWFHCQFENQKKSKQTDKTSTKSSFEYNG